MISRQSSLGEFMMNHIIRDKNRRDHISAILLKAFEMSGTDLRGWLATEKCELDFPGFSIELDVLLLSEKRFDATIGIDKAYFEGSKLILGYSGQFPTTVKATKEGCMLRELISHPILNHFDMKILGSDESYLPVPASWEVDNPGSPRPDFIIETLIYLEWADVRPQYIPIKDLI